MDFSVLASPLAEALAARGIRKPSPVQSAVIPLLMEETAPAGAAVTGAAAGPLRLLFTAPTGTGKTFAYLLPLLQRLAEGEDSGGRTRGPELLVLAPTHELCSQIKSELDFVLRALGMPPSQLLIGSVSPGRQIEALKKNKPRAAAGNPARVLQLVRMKKLSLGSLRFLVLDEGDRLVAEELCPETRELVFLAGGNSGIIACSATMNGKSRDALFGLEGEKRPWRIVEEDGLAVLQHNIEHWAFFAEDRKKPDLLKSFLAAVRPKKTLVFTSRGGDVGRIVSRLQYRRIAAGGIRGDMDKKARKAAIDGFRKGTIPVLVASDLACRGLDVEGISHVISLDTGDNAEAYLHRAGRTGRAGRRGIMVTIGSEEELRRLRRIEKKLKIIVYPKELYGGRVTAPPVDEEPGKTD
ncbi:MAG: DEAD/DEAH box helicase [Spirochaetaceae bacterium]|nr:DEAD/DEAH box helicase [Spirochaetaceae bacterium]